MNNKKMERDNLSPGASSEVDYSILDITPIFPTNGEADIDFDTLDCVPVGEVHIVEDEELGNSLVIELSGKDSRITFYTQVSNRLLVCYINNCRRYVTISLILVDSEGVERFLEVTNQRSTVFVENNVAKLPMEIDVGWQRFCLDVDDVLYKCFGTRLQSCPEIIVSGGARLFKLFFQGDDYADPQLPPFLRVLVV